MDDNDNEVSKIIAASNALSLLNMSRYNFSGLDLSFIRTKQANLSYGIFSYTNFEGADLEGANMYNSFFYSCNFKRAKLKDIFLGEYQPI